MKSKEINIRNPYTDLYTAEEYKCFGCSPSNKFGLHLTFSDCGDYIKSIWKPTKTFEGFFQVLHGGIQSTLLDEIAGWTVFTKCKTSGVTKSMCVEYLKPVYITDETIKLTAGIIESGVKTAKIKAQLFNSKDELCTQAEVVYAIFSEAVAKRKHNYPGVDAYYNR